MFSWSGIDEYRTCIYTLLLGMELTNSDPEIYSGHGIDEFWPWKYTLGMELTDSDPGNILWAWNWRILTLEYAPGMALMKTELWNRLILAVVGYWAEVLQIWTLQQTESTPARFQG
jgi:hypothetical protein